MEEVRYMISEASKRVEVEAHTLRYWEDELMLPVARNEMDHRYYRESDIELLKTIKKLKDQGFQLKAIKLLLPNLHKLDTLDATTMLKLKDELNGKVTEMAEEINDQNADETVKNEGTSLVTSEKENELSDAPGDKMSQFKTLMNHIILNALKENNTVLSDEISMNVTDNVVKEMNFLMRLQEEREEERFKKFDATLRDYQKSRSMAAAALEGKGKKKSKFAKKNRLYI